MIKKTGWLTLLFVFTISSVAVAQPHRNSDKQLTRKVIKRTAVIIKQARMAVKENRNFTGDLVKAVRHQKMAKQLFRTANYMKAAHHSLRARQFAFAAIKANKGKVPDEVFKDETAIAPSPATSQLEDEVAIVKPGDPLKDEEIIAMKIDDDLE